MNTKSFISWSKNENVITVDRIRSFATGDGTAMMNALIEELKKTETADIEVTLVAEQISQVTDLDRLVRFYESFGFSVDEVEQGMSGIPMSTTIRGLHKRVSTNRAVRVSTATLVKRMI